MSGSGMTTENFGYINVQAEPRSAANTSPSTPELPGAAKNGVSWSTMRSSACGRRSWIF